MSAETTNDTVAFRHDVLEGLDAANKSLPCKYFYDELGCRLFEQICQTEDYYVTRTELDVMRQHAQSMAEAMGPDCMVVEYGSGEGVKIRLLLEHLESPAAYVPVDIAGDHLQDIAEALNRDYEDLEVAPVTADFTLPFQLPEISRTPRRRVAYFPGSTLGNFTREAAMELLRSIRALVGDGGGLLLGVDLVKEAEVLNAAYNDSEGVTAEFNKNLLTRINRELDGDLDLDQFEHEARFDPQQQRVEICLRSSCDQEAVVSGRRIQFRKNERIHTEFSHKYRVEAFQDVAGPAGWTVARHWTDSRQYFAVIYLEAS